MSQDSTKPHGDPHEFRHYRLALAGIYFAALSLGALLLLASIVYDLFLRRGEPGPTPTSADLVQCATDVRRLLEDLGRTSSTLERQVVTGEMPDPAARWEEFSHDWEKRWETVGARCQFDRLADTGLGQAYDRMAWVHRNLPTLKLKYREMMKRFSDDIADEVTAMRKALDKGERLLRKQTGAPPASPQQGPTP